MSVERALIAAFASRLGPVEVASHVIAPWHSATFSGARHTFKLVVNTSADTARFAKVIGEAEIPVPGGFVADVVVDAYSPGDTRLNIGVLTIDA